MRNVKIKNDETSEIRLLLPTLKSSMVYQFHVDHSVMLMDDQNKIC